MSTFTTDTPVTADTDSAGATTPTRGRTIDTRIAGIGGLAFIANVVVNNVLRGSFPKNDASATDVATFYAEHDVLTNVFAAIYPIGLVGIALFVAGVASRALSGPGRLSAITGIVGSAGVAGGFSTMLAFDSAIAGYLHRGGTSNRRRRGPVGHAQRRLRHPPRFDRRRPRRSGERRGLRWSARPGWRPVSFVGAALLLAGRRRLPRSSTGHRRCSSGSPALLCGWRSSSRPRCASSAVDPGR